MNFVVEISLHILFFIFSFFPLRFIGTQLIIVRLLNKMNKLGKNEQVVKLNEREKISRE